MLYFSCVVRAFAHYVIGCHLAISCSSQCSMTDVTKTVVSVILSVGWCIQKYPCCQLERVAHVVAAAGLRS